MMAPAYHSNMAVLITLLLLDDTANTDDGSCIPVLEGCTYELATNYNPIANVDDGSCLYSGCKQSKC